RPSDCQKLLAAFRLKRNAFRASGCGRAFVNARDAGLIKFRRFRDRGSDRDFADVGMTPPPLVGSVEHRPISPPVVDEAEAGVPIRCAFGVTDVPPAVNLRSDLLDLRRSQT